MNGASLPRTRCAGVRRIRNGMQDVPFDERKSHSEKSALNKAVEVVLRYAVLSRDTKPCDIWSLAATNHDGFDPRSMIHNVYT